MSVRRVIIYNELVFVKVMAGAQKLDNNDIVPACKNYGTAEHMMRIRFHSRGVVAGRNRDGDLWRLPPAAVRFHHGGSSAEALQIHRGSSSTKMEFYPFSFKWFKPCLHLSTITEQYTCTIYMKWVSPTKCMYNCPDFSSQRTLL